MKQRIKTTDSASGAVQARRKLAGRVLMRGEWDFVCRDANGRVKWREHAKNIVTNAGLDHTLDSELSGGTPVTTWYLGLTDGTPTVAAGDTSSSHAGWAEVTAYDEAVRQTWTDGGVSSQSVDNSGSPAVFTISSDSTTVGGAFMISNSTKGGSTGTLFAVVAFTAGDKVADDNDTITVTYTVSAADDGA